MSKEIPYFVSEAKEVPITVKKLMCKVKYVDSDGNYKTKNIPVKPGQKPRAKKYNELKAHSLAEAKRLAKAKKKGKKQDKANK